MAMPQSTVGLKLRIAVYVNEAGPPPVRLTGPLSPGRECVQCVLVLG